MSSKRDRRNRRQLSVDLAALEAHLICEDARTGGFNPAVHRACAVCLCTVERAKYAAHMEAHGYTALNVTPKA